ncbi:MAG: response regulator [Candidatus Pacebacteria bacterium]|nr:response regulator [Candidatus Paceibacterota bacterium]
MTELNKKLLIVEDDEHVAKVYDVKFSKEGYQTVFATNGEDAIAKITTEKPDLIILDLMMPLKDGFGVLEEIKKNPDLARIPVIVLSNLGQPSDQERALALGANEYLVKVNYSMQEVVDKVKSYL